MLVTRRITRFIPIVLLVIFVMVIAWVIAVIRQTPFFTISAHSGHIWTLSFSSDGDRLASGGGDGRVCIWDTHSRKQLMSFQADSDAVYSVAFSPNNSLLATGGLDGTPKLWDAKTGKLVRAFQRHGSRIRAVAFSTDGKVLAFCDCDGFDRRTTSHVRSWNVTSGTLAWDFTVPGSGVCSLAFSPRNNILAAGCQDGSGKLWDLDEGTLRATLPVTDNDVRSIAVTKDGRTLVTGSHGNVELWDIDTLKRQRYMHGDLGGIFSVGLSTNGKWLASGHSSCFAEPAAILFWDPATGYDKGYLKGNSRTVLAVAFSERLFASGGGDGRINLWEADQLGALLEKE